MYQDMITKPIFHCCNHPEELIDNFVKTLYDISQKAKNILLEKYNYIIERLEEKDAERMKIGVLLFLLFHLMALSMILI